ncbi:hypothetical protein PG2022B_0349 [Bifidobacterium animalis subsp. animalis]|nr:hypothetical protein PG2022B_0349 [Bifidobacterium animalis subsp. animalis]
MGMRKGRSGESPHEKNCGMRSRLAGAVRCLVHACLTAAANVAALCMKGWRWMLGAFARTRTSAKRTLTNIEGVLVTLALIATLGIASPLAAGAVEPVEDPTPVSGVLDADGAQIADAADSDDVTDESDVADSDETAKDDTSADQDATEGDAADEATEDAGTDTDVSEKDASTDGEQSDGASDNASKDGMDAVISMGGTAGESVEKKSENIEARASDDEWANSNGEVIPEGHRAAGTDIFTHDGGYYNPLGYILSNYNAFVKEDLGGTASDTKTGHMVGPVFVGRDFHNNANVYGNGNYDHKVSSYVGGIWEKTENGVQTDDKKSNPLGLHLYLGKDNYNQEKWSYTGDATEKKYGPLLNESKDGIRFTKPNQYVADIDAMFTGIQNQATALAAASGVIDVSTVENTNNVQFGENAASTNEWGHLYLKAGHTYKISKDILNKRQHKDAGIILTVDQVVSDASKLPETIIICEDESDDPIKIPVLEQYKVEGEEKPRNFNVTEGNIEAFEGLPLVFMYPKATKVEHPGAGQEFGHVVAPNAAVKIGTQFNGCVIAKSAVLTSEGHMWPYNGTRLSVHKSDKFTLRANKAMIGRSLKDGEFTFQLWEANANWGHSGGSPIQTTTNDANGAINFNEITVTRNNVHVQWSCLVPFLTGQTCTETKTLRYIVEEVKPNNADSSIAYDATVFRVEVSATLTADYSKNPLDPDTTIVVAEPVYTPVNVSNNADHLQGGKPLFTNKVKTTKLKVKKDVTGGDAGNETFTFNVTLTLPYGTDPNALSRLNTTSTSSTAGKIFFDADESHTGTNGTYGYACMPNSAQTACLTDSSGIVKLPLLVDSADKIDFVDTTKFDIELVPFSQNSPVKYLKLKPKGDNKVPKYIERSSLAGADFMGYTSVQCPADNQKQCLQKTISVSMTAGGEEELDKLPVGTTYTVQETNIPEGFELVGFNCSANTRSASTSEIGCSGALRVDQSGNPVQVSMLAVNKRKTVQLSIKKIVDNWDENESSMSDDEKNSKFTFSVSLYDKDGKALSGSYVYKVYDENNNLVKDAGGTLTCSTTNGSAMGTCGTLELKHNQKAVIEGLPYGTRFVVKETDPSDPFEFVKQEVNNISGSNCQEQNAACAVTSTGVLVTVHNRYELRVVLPETGGKAHPFMTMLFGVGVVCAGLLITAIYMRRQGMAMLQ